MKMSLIFITSLLRRLPDELNGFGCFGGALIRVLLGAGYHVHTSENSIALAPSSGAALEPDACGCLSASRNDTFKFLQRMDRCV